MNAGTVSACWVMCNHRAVRLSFNPDTATIKVLLLVKIPIRL